MDGMDLMDIEQGMPLSMVSIRSIQSIPPYDRTVPGISKMRSRPKASDGV